MFEGNARQKLMHHMLHFVSYCSIADDSSQPYPDFYLLAKCMVGTAVRDALPEHVKKLVKLAHLARIFHDQESVDDLKPIVNLLGCVKNFSECFYFRDYLEALHWEAKCQAVLKAHENSGIRAATWLFKEYFQSVNSSAHVQLASSLRAILAAESQNSFPTEALDFLGQHKFEDFQKSGSTFISELLGELPQPQILELLLTLCREEENILDSDCQDDSYAEDTPSESSHSSTLGRHRAIISSDESEEENEPQATKDAFSFQEEEESEPLGRNQGRKLLSRKKKSAREIRKTSAMENPQPCDSEEESDEAPSLSTHAKGSGLHLRKRKADDDDDDYNPRRKVATPQPPIKVRKLHNDEDGEAPGRAASPPQPTTEPQQVLADREPEQGSSTSGPNKGKDDVLPGRKKLPPAIKPRQKIANRKPKDDDSSCSISWSSDDDDISTPPSRLPRANCTLPRRAQSLQPSTSWPSPPVVKRRHRVFWSQQEEELLRKGVRKFGAGNWKQILRAYPFNSVRTTVCLKDKWRNIMNKELE